MSLVYACYVCRTEIRPYMFNGIKLPAKPEQLDRYLCVSCIEKWEKYLERFILWNSDLRSKDAWLDMHRGIEDVKAGRVVHMTIEDIEKL